MAGKRREPKAGVEEEPAATSGTDDDAPKVKLGGGAGAAELEEAVDAATGGTSGATVAVAAPKG